MLPSLQSTRNAFISGLLLLAPLGVCVFVINFLITNVGDPASKLFFSSLKIQETPFSKILLSIAAIILVSIAITLFGFLSKYVMGRFIVRFTEALFRKLPFFNSIYKTVKQIIDTFASQKTAVFQKVVMVEFPRKGVYVIGFLTGEAKGEIETKCQTRLLNIFVPTTPNPTSGFLLMLPPEDVTVLDMSIAEGMKLIISGGAVIPEQTTNGTEPAK